jgi:glycine betaine/choline ABC-type transport system substrate-binding protein
MIRRRTLVAAVVVLIVASLVSSADARVSAPASTAATTISLGTKDFTEEFVLGQLYKQALEHKGIKVKYHENIGSTEVIQTALRSGKINAYPEYVG